MNKKLIRNISWVFIFLFIYQWCGVKTIYAADPIVEEIDLAKLGGTPLDVYINNKINNDNVKEFYIRDGNYDLIDSITINKPGVKIYGQSNGTILKQTNPGSAKSFVITSDNIELSNFKIVASTGADVINVRNVNYINIHNCDITGSSTNPVISIAGAGSYNKIKDNTITAGNVLSPSYGVAIDYIDQTNGEISGNDVYFGSVEVRNNNDLIIDNNKSNNSLRSGIYVDLPGENIKVTNNVIQNTEGAGITIHSSPTGRYKGIQILNNIIKDTKYFGIDINNLDSGIIAGNEISDIDFHGIYAIRSDNLDIENNKISNCERYSGASPKWGSPIKAAMYLEVGVNKSIIKDNIIHNDDTYPCYYGMIIQNGNNNMYNNIFSNSVSGKFTEFVSANIGSPEYTNILEKDTVTDNSISLKWIQMYKDARYDLKVDGVLVHNISVESYNHIGLESNTEHTYQIAIVGIDKWSNEIKIKTLFPAPINFRIAVTTESSIQIVWDKVNSSTEYEVEADGDVKSPIYDVSYKDIGLLSGTTHKYRVRIKNGKWSEYIFANTLGSQTPGVLIPQNIRASSTQNTITISWDEIESATEYEIEVDGIIEPVGTNEKYKHKGLKSNSKHKYRVRVKGGDWSPVLIVKTSNSTSSSKETKSKNSNNENNEFDKVEIYFGNKRNFNYKDPIIENAKVDMLNRLFICKFEENYYLGIRAWKNNEVKIETEYKLNLTPGNSLTFNKLENKVNDQSYQIKEISIQDTDEHLFYASDFENITLSKHIIGNGYMIWIDDIEIKIKENEKYITSKSFII